MGKMKQAVSAIAIDGPSGAGKSTVAKEVARELGFQYIDTGAMYRGVTLKVLEANIDPRDEAAVTEAAKNCVLTLGVKDDATTLALDGKDVSQAIRGVEVTANVSTVCSYQGVREALVEQQRAMARAGGVVMDGRDIGSHVLPQAALKIFLTASPQERGRRRYLEWRQKGVSDMTLEAVIADINRRDHLDSTRKINPLKQAEDAVLLPSDGMSVAEVTAKIIALWKERN